MQEILTGRKTGRPLKIWVAQGPKHNAVTRLIEELGGLVVANAEIAQYAIVEQRATDLGRVFAKVKRDNPDVHILSHQWLYDCRDKKRRLDIAGYEITKQPLPPAKKGTRTAFTPEDDMKLVKFIARNSKPRGRLGHSLYEDVERALPNHTASSWRQRYKTNQARLDQEIARYEAIIQQRRDNHEDPYTDSEDESAAKFTATSGRGAWPSKSQIAQKKQPRAAEPIREEQSTSLQVPPSHSQGLKRSAIKSQRPPVEASQPSQTEERRFRLDLQGPGERITFSDEEEESDTIHVPSHEPQGQEADEGPSQFTQESITESVREELKQRGFPPLARKRRRSVSEAHEEEITYITHAVQSQQQAFFDVPSSPPASNVVTSLPEQFDTRTRTSGRLSSCPLSTILTEDHWTPAHLNTLMSAGQMEDLIFVCTGDTSLASQIATLLYQSEVDGWNAVLKQRAGEMRKMMWSPEEDASLAEGTVTKSMLQRHGQDSVKARIEFLQEKYAGMDDEERVRRRFPYDGSAA